MREEGRAGAERVREHTLTSPVVWAGEGLLLHDHLSSPPPPGPPPPPPPQCRPWRPHPRPRRVSHCRRATHVIKHEKH